MCAAHACRGIWFRPGPARSSPGAAARAGKSLLHRARPSHGLAGGGPCYQPSKPHLRSACSTAVSGQRGEDLAPQQPAGVGRGPLSCAALRVARGAELLLLLLLLARTAAAAEAAAAADDARAALRCSARGAERGRQRSAVAAVVAGGGQAGPGCCGGKRHGARVAGHGLLLQLRRRLGAGRRLGRPRACCPDPGSAGSSAGSSGGVSRGGGGVAAPRVAGARVGVGRGVLQGRAEGRGQGEGGVTRWSTRRKGGSLLRRRALSCLDPSLNCWLRRSLWRALGRAAPAFLPTPRLRSHQCLQGQPACAAALAPTGAALEPPHPRVGVVV